MSVEIDPAEYGPLARDGIEFLRAGDKVRILDADPADPAAVQYWDRTGVSIVGERFTVDADLVGYDPAKKYIVCFQPYAACVAGQREWCFLADALTGEVVPGVVYRYT